VIVMLGAIVTAGATSLTVIVKVSASLSVGMPLSVTRTVTV